MSFVYIYRDDNGKIAGQTTGGEKISDTSAEWLTFVLTNAKQSKLAELKIKVENISNNMTIIYNNKILDADWNSGMNINASVTVMEVNKMPDIQWKCKDNTFIKLTLEELRKVGNMVFVVQNTLRNVKKEQIRTLINNATTKEEVNAIDIDNLLL